MTGANGVVVGNYITIVFEGVSADRMFAAADRREDLAVVAGQGLNLAENCRALTGEVQDVRLGAQRLSTKAARPAEKPFERYDSQLPGSTLRVQPYGVRRF